MPPCQTGLLVAEEVQLGRMVRLGEEACRKRVPTMMGTMFVLGQWLLLLKAEHPLRMQLAVSMTTEIKQDPEVTMCS